MQIDFNHVRRKAGNCYNELARFLNDKNNEGTISFDDTDIEETLFDLRCAIGAIMCTYEEGDDGFQSLHNEPYLVVFETYEQSLIDESNYHAQ